MFLFSLSPAENHFGARILSINDEINITKGLCVGMKVIFVPILQLLKTSLGYSTIEIYDPPPPPKKKKKKKKNDHFLGGRTFFF